MKKRTVIALISTLGLLSSPLAFAEGGMKDSQQQQEEVQQQDPLLEQDQPQEMQEGESQAQHEQSSYNTLDQLSTEQVTEIQQELNKKGFSSGNVDGVVGPETRSAIENFQQSEGLAATGDVDQETLDKLEVDIKLQAQEEGEEQRQEDQQTEEDSGGLFD